MIFNLLWEISANHRTTFLKSAVIFHNSYWKMLIIPKLWTDYPTNLEQLLYLLNVLFKVFCMVRNKSNRYLYWRRREILSSLECGKSLAVTMNACTSWPSFWSISSIGFLSFLLLWLLHCWREDSDLFR